MANDPEPPSTPDRKVQPAHRSSSGAEVDNQHTSNAGIKKPTPPAPRPKARFSFHSSDPELEEGLGLDQSVRVRKARVNIEPHSGSSPPSPSPGQHRRGRRHVDKKRLSWQVDVEPAGEATPPKDAIAHAPSASSDLISAAAAEQEEYHNMAQYGHPVFEQYTSMVNFGSEKDIRKHSKLYAELSVTLAGIADAKAEERETRGKSG